MKERLVNADVARVLAMVMVVLFHTIGQFTIRSDFFNTKLYWVYLLIVTISRFAVLLFFMLSGYLVLRKKRTVKENCQKVVLRIVVPLVFFTGVNIFLEGLTFDWQHLSVINFIGQQVTRMSKEISSPMWFLLVLMFLQILNPVWQKLIEKPTPFFGLVVLGAFFYSIGVTLFEYGTGHGGEWFSSLTYWTGFIAFYLYGRLVTKNGGLKIASAWWGLLLFGSFVASLLGNHFHLQQIHLGERALISRYFVSYLSLPALVMAVSLFNLLMRANLAFLRGRWLNFWVGAAFGIYLLHPYVIRFLMDYAGFRLDHLKINIYLFVALDILIVYSSSLILITIIKRTPMLKAVIGDKL